jgi:hypothetical protein
MLNRIVTAWALAAAMLLAFAPLAAAVGPERHSGTVLSVSPDARTLVLAELGLWRVRNGVTEVTRVTVAMTASTEYTSLSRASHVPPTGWVGDYVEAAAARQTMAQGDFVTVVAHRDGGRLTAIKVQRVSP